MLNFSLLKKNMKEKFNFIGEFYKKKVLDLSDNFLVRLSSSLFLSFLFLLSFFYGQFSFYIFSFICFFFLLLELSIIWKKKCFVLYQKLNFIFLIFIFLIQYFYPIEKGIFSFYLFFFSFYVYIVCILLYEFSKKDFFQSIENISTHIFLSFYIFLSCFIFLQLYNEDKNALFFIIFISFTNDAAAYLGGKFLGKYHLLFIKVSSKKTLEGFLIGIFSSIFIGLFLIYFFPYFFQVSLNKIYSFNIFFFAGLVLALTQILGDLLGSLLKRSVNLKHSSSFIPGLGGFLDTFDGLLLSIPVFYLFYSIFDSKNWIYLNF